MVSLMRRCYRCHLAARPMMDTCICGSVALYRGRHPRAVLREVEGAEVGEVVEAAMGLAVTVVSRAAYHTGASLRAAVEARAVNRWGISA